jgi:hypothetical protein
MLDLEIRTKGRATKGPPPFGVPTALTEADVALLASERGTKAPTLKRIRDVHHTLAQMVAQGASLAEIMAVTGYSASRISILRSDPAFKELVAHYHKVSERVYANAVEVSTGIYLDTLRDLAEEAEAGNLSVRERLELARVAGAGAGFNRSTTEVNVSMTLAKTVEAGRKRAATVIDAAYIAAPKKESAA